MTWMIEKLLQKREVTFSDDVLASVDVVFPYYELSEHNSNFQKSFTCWLNALTIVIAWYKGDAFKKKT